MPTKRSAAKKKAIRTRKLKSADRKAAKKKRRAVARKAVAAKLPSAAAEAPLPSQEHRLSLQKCRLPPQKRRTSYWTNWNWHSPSGLLSPSWRLLLRPQILWDGFAGESQEQTPKFSRTSTFRLPSEAQYFHCTVRTVEPLIESALAVIVDFPAANARATP